jgi:small conductance mechanosensitive channel
MIKRTVSHTMVGKSKTAIKKRTDTLSNVFIQTGMVFVGVVAIFTIVAELGINIAPALAGLGVAGIAVGFGAQSLVKDIFNGILILLENQYGIGDVVKIAGITGLVEDVTLRRTVLRDLDGIVHSIPNSEIGVASNYTKEWSRVNMNISVGYGEDLDHVIEVINRVGKDLAEDPDWAPQISKAPEVLRVDEFGDSGIAIKILGETKPLAQWDVMGELRLRLKKVFDKEGIEIPWPHIKLFFGNTPEISIKRLAGQETPEASSDQQPSERKRHRKLPPD